MILDGRRGVGKRNRASQIAGGGARLGCHHCKGVMARCYFDGLGCSKNESKSLELARASASRGSKYGQWALGELYRTGVKGPGGFTKDYKKAVAQYGLAAAQGYDVAQNSLGLMYGQGLGVAQDYAQALFWFKLAAAQWFGAAMYNVGTWYENGRCVAANKEEAIRCYKQANSAGSEYAADKLRQLGV
jgi:TPR repeat protein